MGAHALAAFIPTAFLLALAPGPDNLGVLALGLSTGRRASLGFAIGCACGCLNHTLLAVFGVSALIAASPLAFRVLQWGGALYLVWIGLQALRHAASAGAAPAPGATTAEDRFTPHFRRGLIANAINPKVALFFLAFLPQFVSPEGWIPGAQLAVLGTLMALESALVFSLIALASGSIGRSLARRPRLMPNLQRATGLLFLALAARLAGADLAAPAPR